MADRGRKKQKQRLKREQKKLAHRRAQSVSPYKRIAESGDVQACYICSGWKENGLASIHLVRRNPQGGFALAAYLVDIWCAGLKDAYGGLDLGSDEVDEHLERASSQVRLERINVSVARDLVAGSIRFARQNGFRLPAHYDRWVKLLGEIPDPNEADLSNFGKDGKLFWVGPLDDLRSRLIGSTYEEFIARPDVDFLAEADSPWDAMAEDDEEEFLDDDEEISDEEFDALILVNEQILKATSDLALTTLTRMLADKGEPPHPRLDEAVMLCTLSEDVDLNMDTDEVETLDLLERTRYYASEAIISDLGLTEADIEVLAPAVAQLKPYWPAVLEEVDQKMRVGPDGKPPALLKSLLRG